MVVTAPTLFTDPAAAPAVLAIGYSNWQGPVWINANYLFFIGLRNYGFDAQCRELAYVLGGMLSRDIDANSSMHENYNGDTGEPLAPTAAQSKGGIFTGFVGWDLLCENMLMAVAENRWMMLEIH